ncbi:MAG: MFS transporter [Pseudomonadales bacterium]
MTTVTTTASKGWPKRYKMMTLLMLALLLCYIDRTLISLAVIEMQKEFDWSDSDKGLILSSFFFGYLFMQVAGGLLANKYGGRNVFFIAVLLWSLFTVLTPVAASISLTMLLFARFILGFGEGAALPASYNLVHKWMPSHERSRSVSMFSAASSIGTVAALLLTGVLIEKFGWPFVFYLFGSMGIVWALFWLWQVPSVAETPEELNNVEHADTAEQKQHRKIPWKILLAHPAVTTLYLLTVCFSGISYTLASWLPSYFVDTFEVSTSMAGIYAILPWAVLGVASMLAGIYADRQLSKGVKALRVRKTLVAAGLALVCLAMTALTIANTLMMAVLLVCFVFTGLAIIVPGYVPIPGEILPQHGDILYGFMAGVGSIASMLIIGVTGFILEATDSYNMLWVCMAVLSALSIVIFQFLAQASPIDPSWGQTKATET